MPVEPQKGLPLNESPSEKEGKYKFRDATGSFIDPSMKVPPKRNGNLLAPAVPAKPPVTLNESPSEKEGK